MLHGDHGAGISTYMCRILITQLQTNIVYVEHVRQATSPYSAIYGIKPLLANETGIESRYFISTNKNMMSVYLNMARVTDRENDYERLDSRVRYSHGFAPRKITGLHVVALPDLMFLQRQWPNQT